MPVFKNEPVISVGLMEKIDKACFETVGTFLINDKELSSGKHNILCKENIITLVDPNGKKTAVSKEIVIKPDFLKKSSFIINNIKIGINFHWERILNQEFRGSLKIKAINSNSFTLINIIPLEAYLEAVICSEMSAESPIEFLKAHCAISRSWLLAQLNKKQQQTKQDTTEKSSDWTDSQKHKDFDVCADDHCQRYHGIKSINPSVKKALKETRGEVLMSEGEICDTRFSKCCGGITERFSTCWEDTDFTFLTPVIDGPGNNPQAYPANEKEFYDFIISEPDSFCNLKNIKILSRILPDFDQETNSFFRWTVNYSQQELKKILLEKTGIDFGNIINLIPVLRGASGRIINLRIVGQTNETEIKKELEIRKALSKTHLYSSAFVVIPYGNEGSCPEGFTLRGAGWGHGVGLCQIGAASMAEKGYNYESILSHYFKNTIIKKIY
jgi:SpoIID/LytB domain protein